MFLKAARHAELDIMKGVSANVMCGQEGFYGTNAFQVLLDTEQMLRLKKETPFVYKDANEEINNFFEEEDGRRAEDAKACGGIREIVNNVSYMTKQLDDDMNTDYNPGF